MDVPDFFPWDGKQLLVVAGASLSILAILLVLVNPSGVEFKVSGENVSCGAPTIPRGENYSYLVGGAAQNFSATLYSSGLDVALNCYLFHQESGLNSSVDACFSRVDGKIARVSSRGAEISLESLAGQPPLIGLEPWMACARPGWSGTENFSRSLKPGIIQVMPVSDVIENDYYYAATETALGRTAYRIEEKSYRVTGEGVSAQKMLVGGRTVWVDAEKKIMLKEEVPGAGGFAAVLVSAPFQLNESD